MIRSGHINIHKYRIGFVVIALEELHDYISESIRYKALAHKCSKLDEKNFNDFMINKTDEPQKTINHEANIQKAKG